MLGFWRTLAWVTVIYLALKALVHLLSWLIEGIEGGHEDESRPEHH